MNAPQTRGAKASRKTQKSARGISLKPNIGETVLPGNPAATLSIAVITIDEAIQQRASMDDDLVMEYQINIGEWIAQAPVIVYGTEGVYWLADGFHRLAAASGAGLTEIPVIIHPGVRRDALLYAIGANATHGKPRTNADKRRAVETLLSDAEWSGRSDRWIAETAKVSDKTVTKIRFEVRKSAIEQVEIESTPTPNAATPTTEPLQPLAPVHHKRIGRDGKARTVANKPTPPADPKRARKQLDRKFQSLPANEKFVAVETLLSELPADEQRALKGADGDPSEIIASQLGRLTPIDQVTAWRSLGRSLPDGAVDRLSLAKDAFLNLDEIEAIEFHRWMGLQYGMKEVQS